ncbi:MAG: hypothetical protein Q9M46_07795, partial [Ghiorsea sp.]|nr:hypothetical protein [Ghiorsea sp.]
HDVGRSGWWQVTPYIGMTFSLIGIFQESKILMISGAIFMLSLTIILLIFLVKPSDEDNQYGVKP